MDETQAVRSLKQGNLDGLETLVQNHQVKAVRAAYLILGDRGLAQEVVQKAFIKIAGRIDQFDERYPFAPWFYRIVVNDARKRLRNLLQIYTSEQEKK